MVGTALAKRAWNDLVLGQIVAVFGRLRQGDQDLTTDAVRELAGRAPYTFATFARDHAGMFRS